MEKSKMNGCNKVTVSYFAAKWQGPFADAAFCVNGEYHPALRLPMARCILPGTGRFAQSLCCPTESRTRPVISVRACLGVHFIRAVNERV